MAQRGSGRHSAQAEKTRLSAATGAQQAHAAGSGSQGHCIGGLFTGRQLQAGTAFVDGCGQTAGWADGISVDLELDMLAAAFACDLTRVASFQISTSLNRIRYPWLNSLGEAHALSHAGPSDTDAHDQLIARQTWHSGRLAYLLSRLGSIQESDGSTVLDNTLVLWGNEVALGYTHAHENMPFLMAGRHWHFRTGRYITHQSASHNDLLVSVLNAMGVPATSFGQPDLCNGPLSGLT